MFSIKFGLINSFLFFFIMIEIDQHVLKIDKISTLRFINASRAIDSISHIFHPRNIFHPRKNEKRASISFTIFFWVQDSLFFLYTKTENFASPHHII
jgi:hypothetical protein